MFRKLAVSVLIVFLCVLTGCQAARQQRKNDAESHYLLGLSYLSENRTSEALKEFLQAADIDPSDAEIQSSLGYAFHLKQAYAEAEVHYQEAISLNPGDSKFKNNLGALYLDMKRWDDAIGLFRQVCADLLFTRPELAYAALGSALHGKGEYLEAVAAYTKALDLSPIYPQAHLGLGETYYALGRNDLAIEQYEAALRQAPNYTLAHYRLGLSWMKSDMKSKAADEFRAVCSLAPESPLGRLAKDHLRFLE